MNHATEWNSISSLMRGPWIEKWVNLVPNSDDSSDVLKLLKLINLFPHIVL